MGVAVAVVVVRKVEGIGCWDGQQSLIPSSSCKPLDYDLRCICRVVVMMMMVVVAVVLVVLVEKSSSWVLLEILRMRRGRRGETNAKQVVVCVEPLL